MSDLYFNKSYFDKLKYGDQIRYVSPPTRLTYHEHQSYIVCIMSEIVKDGDIIKRFGDAIYVSNANICYGNPNEYICITDSNSPHHANYHFVLSDAFIQQIDKLKPVILNHILINVKIKPKPEWSYHKFIDIDDYLNIYIYPLSEEYNDSSKYTIKKHDSIF